MANFALVFAMGLWMFPVRSARALDRVMLKEALSRLLLTVGHLTGTR
jgi:hypothetical protein